MPKHPLLDKLFRRHSMELVAFANSHIAHSEAEDLVQEAYLRLLQHPDCAAIYNPRAYLYKIIANLGFDYHHRASVHHQYLEPNDIEPDSLISPLPSLETLMDGQLLLNKCLLALETLPDVYRHVFLLNRVDGLSHKEIAEALAVPQRTVERYCAKALAHCFTATFHDKS
ncbi:MAG: RNA polymerase sigma factor [Methylococcales bacterium]|nr:RNA polymerase sigma factor [Methylococcales bacterium]